MTPDAQVAIAQADATLDVVRGVLAQRAELGDEACLARIAMTIGGAVLPPRVVFVDPAGGPPTEALAPDMVRWIRSAIVRGPRSAAEVLAETERILAPSLRADPKPETRSSHSPNPRRGRGQRPRGAR